MSDNIIEFAKRGEPPNPGNGAREAVIDFALQSEIGHAEAEFWSDLVLAELWMRGFKVVPLDGSE